VWNTALEQRRLYRAKGAWMNYVPQAAQLTEARAAFPWLAEVSVEVLQQTLMDLDKACREHGTFRVRWRSKARWHPSFRFPRGERIVVERLAKKWGRAKLPKLGWVRFRWSRALGGAVRSATVGFKAGQWWVSFLIEDGETTPEEHERPGTWIGVDRGVAVAVATSTGQLLDREGASRGEAERYRRLQQKLARQRKGSNRRRETVAKLAKAGARRADRTGDFCAQAAAVLSAGHDVIVLEDLRVKNMTAGARGTVDEPGRNPRQKAGLNRAILAKGWGRFELALNSAARRTGSRIVKVDPAYTSQTCYRCKEVDRESRESQAVFRCVACGYREHADVNAAGNILDRAAGPAVPGRGDLGDGRSAKRQPSTSVHVPGQRAGTWTHLEIHAL
jgi:putative transposase